MNLTNIRVNRYIAHEVVRKTEAESRPPHYSTNLFEFDNRGKDLVQTRLINAFSGNSKSLEVSVK